MYSGSNEASSAIFRIHKFLALPPAPIGPDAPKVLKAPVLGTCFAFRNSRYFVTAAHVVEGVNPRDTIISVETAAEKITLVADSILRHPTADIAILQVDYDPPPSIRHFKSVIRPMLGQDFFAYGFPVMSDEGMRPRVFTGIFQTFREHESQLLRSADRRRYRYFAGELSIPCPPGLSGGPIFPRDRHDTILGVVTENHEEGTELHQSEEITENGKTFIIRTERVILYGMSVITSEIEAWLTDNIPNV